MGGKIPYALKSNHFINSDDRLTLDKLSRLNKYLSSTVPEVGDYVIRRGSCTCSTIIEEDFLLSKKLLQILVEKNDINYFDKQCQEIIDRLKGIVLSKNDIGDIILFPSGSDAEFLPGFLYFFHNFNLVFLFSYRCSCEKC